MRTFFFSSRSRHTRWPRDWSSDVCSSDLPPDACLPYAALAMASQQVDFAAEGLLDGLEGEQRADRLALLEMLAADGVTLAELRRASASGTLMFMPAERVVGGRRRYTAAEAADSTGIELDFLNAMRR